MLRVSGSEDFAKIRHLPAHVQAAIRAEFLLRKIVQTTVLVAEREEDMQAIRELPLDECCVAVEQGGELFDGEEKGYVKTRFLLGDVRVLFYMPRALVPLRQFDCGEE